MSNGGEDAAISEADRRKYEGQFLQREKEREKRWLRGRPAEEPPVYPGT